MNKIERIKLREYKQRVKNRPVILYDTKALKKDYRFLMSKTETAYNKKRLQFLLRHKLRYNRKQFVINTLRLVKHRIKNLLRFIAYIPKYFWEIRNSVTFTMRQYGEPRRKTRKDLLRYMRENGESLYDFWVMKTIVGQKRPVKKAIKWIRENIIMQFMKCQMQTDDMDNPNCGKKAEYFLRDNEGKKLGYFCYDCYQDIARSYWEREYDL